VEIRGVLGDDDGTARVLQGRNRLVEDFRMLGLRPVAEVAFVIETDGEDLPRLAGYRRVTSESLREDPVSAYPP